MTVSCLFKQAVWPHSGHYRPTEENFHEFISFLAENNVDLTHVKVRIGELRSMMFFLVKSEHGLHVSFSY